MEVRNVGQSDLRVSLVGLGCNNFGGRIDFDASKRVVHRALDAGITLFDTADAYGNRGGSERFLGDLLGERRKDIVIATKFGLPMDDAGKLKGASRQYIVSAMEASLARLRTDWIDLYQLHQPDPKTPVEETLRALDDLVRQGKVRYIGCSNLAGWQVGDAVWTSRHHGLAPFISAQDEYSLLARGHEKHLLPALEHYGMGFLPYYPLAGGMLTGKYRRDAPMPEGARLAYYKPAADKFLTHRNWAHTEALADFAVKHGHTLTDLAFAWLASRSPVSSVIAGATTPEQIDANVRSVSWELDAEALEEINGITAS